MSEKQSSSRLTESQECQQTCRNMDGLVTRVVPETDLDQRSQSVEQTSLNYIAAMQGYQSSGEGKKKE